MAVTSRDWNNRLSSWTTCANLCKKLCFALTRKHSHTWNFNQDNYSLFQILSLKNSKHFVFFSKKNFVQEAVPIRSLLRLLFLSDDCHVQRVVLSLYNALFNISSRDQKLTMRRTMEELNIRNIILTKVWHHSKNTF